MNLISQLSHRYFSRKTLPNWGILLFDSTVFFVSFLFIHTLVSGVGHLREGFGYSCLTALVYLIPYIVGFRLFHTYSGFFRFSAIIDLYRITVANIVGFALGVVAYFAFNLNAHLTPVHTYELLFISLFATIIMWLVRIGVKTLYEYTFAGSRSKVTFIYGTQEGGVNLATHLQAHFRQYRLRGFITDNDTLEGRFLRGVKIHRLDADIVDRMKQRGVEVLFVSPLKSRDFVANTEFVNALIDAGIRIMMLPPSMEWDGKSELTPTVMKEVDVEELLPREKIDVDMEAIGQLLADQVVLITGAAGSIGSEMVRQVAQFKPRRLILIDQAETPMHDIRLEMRNKWPELDALTIVSSITNAARMDDIFSRHRPAYVFHAAAYKHVPMMEDNPSEAIHNNCYGTRVIADLSVKYGVKKFVMISTDKAVNPTNVMGCSKRICEIYVQSLNRAIQEKKLEGITQFVTTRFGNVLGSNGSVIPLFRKQLKAGGPLTVTHPDIIRFFMLIPEACKLVLEAGTMGNGGEIFVFDMGEPVRIADIAKRIIKLSGVHGIEIQYTGLRDGEKLYEEVLNDAEETMPTFHPKIKIAKVREYDYAEVLKAEEELHTLSLGCDDMAIVRKMKAIVPEYKSKQSKYEVLDKE